MDMEIFDKAIKSIRAKHKEDKKTSGVIECPKCKGPLGYSIAESNGHILGSCQTEDCLSWMM